MFYIYICNRMITLKSGILYFAVTATVLCIFCCFREQKKAEQPVPKEFTLSTYEIFPTGMGEMSGLCLNQKKDGLYAVGDEGDIYEIGFDGKTRKIIMNGESHDWEGVDCHGSDILLMEETESSIFRLSGDRLSLIAKVDVPGGGVEGKGPEGIMCVRDTVYVGNQEKPARIVKYSLKSKKACEWFDIDFVTRFISDLSYDPVDDTMWIIDSKGFAIYHCTLGGRLIATYHVPFVVKGEALAVDHANKIIWVGSDKTSELYKIPIEFQI